MSFPHLDGTTLMSTSAVTSFISEDDWVLDEPPPPPPVGATPTLAPVEPLEEDVTSPTSFLTDNL